jgi:hypothetical protein
MVGNIVRREVAEPIFRDLLEKLDDVELESWARSWIWQRETALYGPLDEEEWRCACIREEFQRRAKPEIYLRAENDILAQMRKADCQ